MMHLCPNCNGEQTTPKTVIISGDIPVTIRERCDLCGGVGYLNAKGTPWELSRGWTVAIITGSFVMLCVAIAILKYVSKLGTGG